MDLCEEVTIECIDFLWFMFASFFVTPLFNGITFVVIRCLLSTLCKWQQYFILGRVTTTKQSILEVSAYPRWNALGVSGMYRVLLWECFIPYVSPCVKNLQENLFWIFFLVMPARYHVKNRKEGEHYEKKNACKVQSTRFLWLKNSITL